MSGWNWEEYLVIGLLAICVLGPIVIVLLTQNMLDAGEDIDAGHFDFDANPQGLQETAAGDIRRGR